MDYNSGMERTVGNSELNIGSTSSLPREDPVKGDDSRSDTLEDFCDVNFSEIEAIEDDPLDSLVNARQATRVENKQSPQPHVMFAARLYSYPDVTRRRAEEIITDVNELFGDMLLSIETEVMEAISPLNNSKSVVNKIKSSFSHHRSLFDDVKTEWCCFRKFEKQHSYIPPVHFMIGDRQDFVKQNLSKTMKIIPVTAQFIPMRMVFQRFFQIPMLLAETLEYMKSLSDNNIIISNFIQGTLWREIIAHFDGKTVLPLFLYFDDYENNNPFGSHKGISKCGAVYLSIPCYPPRLSSKLENIFLFILFNTIDRQVFRNNVIFSKAIDELKFLEQHGITINLPDGDKTIYFKLSLVLGDNLGLHSILGFVESFRANIFCRFCYTPNSSIQTTLRESYCQMRTE